MKIRHGGSLCFLFPIATVDFGLLNGDFKKNKYCKK